VPFIDLAASPLAPGVSPVRVHYRDAGAGSPLLFLHSGWGYEIYPFDRQIAALASTHRIVIPDRSGYGRSGAIAALAVDFHARAADETRGVIEALALDRPVVWGHSDGGIIALLLALAAPTLVAGVIAEATHFYRRKPRSRAFFESMRDKPETLSESVTSVLAHDHGTRWPDVIERHSRAWQLIARDAMSDTADFYGGRLGAIAVPLLVVHGARDPRTEPGEIDALTRSLEGSARVVVLSDGGHSPHSEAATADEVTSIAQTFIERVSATLPLPAPES